MSGVVLGRECMFVMIFLRNFQCGKHDLTMTLVE